MSRLATKTWIDGLMRRVQTAGDFATILASGEPMGGAVLMMVRDRNGSVTAYMRSNLGDGQTAWRPLIENEPETSETLTEMLKKQRGFDPDLWVIELDVADHARFVADLDEIS
ncbi:MAG: DUF1491 family protein [Pseudomonadota bacterium]